MIINPRNTFTCAVVKRYITVFIGLIFIAMPTLAQSPLINVKHLDKLSKKASEHVEIALEGWMLNLSRKAIKRQNQPGVSEIIDDIKGIYVHVFSFEKTDEYSSEDIEIIEQQIKMPPWERPVKVKSKHDGVTSVYLLADQNINTFKGLVVLVADKTELVFINIIGNVDLDKFEKLGGNLGIPKIDMKGKGDDD